MKMLTSKEFYDNFGRSGYVGQKEIEPYHIGNHTGSAYEAYLQWYLLEHSPLGQALK
jgi:hypothetical protein